MLKLVIARLAQSIPLLLAVSAFTFFLLFVSPGDFLSQLRANAGRMNLSSEQLHQEEIRWGLDKPWYVIWTRWTTRAVTQADLGLSITERRPVAKIVGERMANTLLLTVTASLIAWFLAIPLGVMAAVRQYGWLDRTASAFSFIGLSIPPLVLGLFALYLAAVTGWFPIGGTTSVGYEKLTTWHKLADRAWHLVLPATVLAVGSLAVLSRQARSNLLDALKADYLRTARAKGVSPAGVIFRHALRNAINPLITLLGFEIGSLLSGALIVENVMAWPGLGQTAITSIFNKDMYVVASTVTLATFLLIVGNLIADLLLAASDPRIRYD